MGPGLGYNVYSIKSPHRWPLPTWRVFASDTSKLFIDTVMDHIFWHQLGLIVALYKRHTSLIPHDIRLKWVRSVLPLLHHAWSLSTSESMRSRFSCNNDGFQPVVLFIPLYPAVVFWYSIFYSFSL